MTHVCNIYNENNANIERLYIVEVVTFDGEAVNVEVYAYNSDEAQAQAADMVENADYTSVIYSEVA